MKRTAALLVGTILLTVTVVAQAFTVRVDGDRLRINPGRLHFLMGEAVDRLRDGATVKYVFELTAKADKNGRDLARTVEEFAISYDLWEEKFAVKKLGSSPRTISHMSAMNAESWCLDNISIGTAALPSNQPIWIRIDYRVEGVGNAGDQTDNSGFTLTGLIDIFSRRPHSEQLHGSEEIGPLRLEGLKRK